MFGIARKRDPTVMDKLLEKLESLLVKLEKLKMSKGTETKKGKGKPGRSDLKAKEKSQSSEQNFKHANPLNQHDQQEESEPEEDKGEKEASSKTIRSFTAIIKWLLEESKKDVTAADVKQAAYKEISLTDKECQAVAKTAKFIKPLYSPETKVNVDAEDQDTFSVFKCAPLAYLTTFVVPFFFDIQE
ncbi:hypothetical protein BDA99DRAFT_535780 [Phascolomyces articulosus]|uniref:Uncharacterized protein n=1 Tax=Phascolomyces articulosus TaxID=60185 RepID=A0AAD5K3X7_9FUNG|nr:hypothetical protein BDA99DRAFT_535780 [Phascolomyces articulosus]